MGTRGNGRAIGLECILFSVQWPRCTTHQWASGSPWFTEITHHLTGFHTSAFTEDFPTCRPLPSTRSSWIKINASDTWQSSAANASKQQQICGDTSRRGWWKDGKLEGETPSLKSQLMTQEKISSQSLKKKTVRTWEKLLHFLNSSTLLQPQQLTSRITRWAGNAQQQPKDSHCSLFAALFQELRRFIDNRKLSQSTICYLLLGLLWICGS